MRCQTCKDIGFVYRPERAVTVPADYQQYEYGRLEPYQVLIEERHGGMDACPECAARAEALYQARRAA